MIVTLTVGRGSFSLASTILPFRLPFSWARTRPADRTRQRPKKRTFRTFNFLLILSSVPVILGLGQKCHPYLNSNNRTAEAGRLYHRSSRAPPSTKIPPRSTEVLPEPGFGLPELVELVVGHHRPVGFSRIDIDLDRSPRRLDGPEELYGLLDCDPLVFFVLREEEGGLDILRIGDRGKPPVDVGILQRRLPEILPEEYPAYRRYRPQALEIGDADLAVGGLEAGRLGDDPVGHVSAVTPSPDDEPILVRQAARDEPIQAGHQVPIVPASPVAEIAPQEGRSPSDAAAHVGHIDEIALSREVLRGAVVVPGEGIVEIPCRSAVDQGHRGIGSAFDIPERIDDVPGDLEPIGRFPGYLFGLSQPRPREFGVEIGQAPGFVGLVDVTDIDFLRPARRSRRERDRPAVGRKGHRVDP